MKEEKKFLSGTRKEDLTGKRFGKLVVVELDYNKLNNDKQRKKEGHIANYSYYWWCVCDCGTFKTVKETHLKSERIKSCGCYSSEVLSEIKSEVKTKSFYDWCVENNKIELLKLWDYNKNTKAPSDVCYASEKKYYFKCYNGIHESELKSICVFTKNIRPSNIWCEECASFIYWGKSNICEDFIDKYIYEKNKIDKIKKLRKHSKVKIKMICQNKYCRRAYPISCSKFVHNRRCPYCSSSRGELKIREFLELNFIKNINQKTFDGLIGLNGGNLSYDFYLPDYELLIEYQGEQHLAPIEYFGGDKEFKKQKNHDRRKRKYAEKNGIKLLEIWYWDFDNIEHILKKELIL